MVSALAAAGPPRMEDFGLAALGMLGFLGWFNFGAFAFGSYIHYYEYFPLLHRLQVFR